MSLDNFSNPRNLGLVEVLYVMTSVRLIGLNIVRFPSGKFSERLFLAHMIKLMINFGVDDLKSPVAYHKLFDTFPWVFYVISQ